MNTSPRQSLQLPQPWPEVWPPPPPMAADSIGSVNIQPQSGIDYNTKSPLFASGNFTTAANGNIRQGSSNNPIVIIPLTPPTPATTLSTTLKSVAKPYNFSAIIKSALAHERDELVNELQWKTSDTTTLTPETSTTVAQQYPATTPQSIEIFIQAPTTSRTTTTTSVKQPTSPSTTVVKHATRKMKRLKSKAKTNDGEDQPFGDSSDVFDTDSKRRYGDQHKPTNQSSMLEVVKKFEKDENEKLEKQIEAEMEKVLKTVKENMSINTTSSLNRHQNTLKSTFTSNERRDFNELKNVINNLTKGIEKMQTENRKITTTTTKSPPLIHPTKIPVIHNVTPTKMITTTTTTISAGKKIGFQSG